MSVFLIGQKSERMKKPWSISTTVRNPDRIRSFLQVVKDFEGAEFNQDQQIKFQIALIQKKLYKPTGLDNKLAKYYDYISDMSFKQAQEIFKHMTKRSSVLKCDPGFRGRTSIAPLSKMGLVVSKKTISKLYLTNFGKRFLKEDFDIGEIFLEYFFKWTLPNPDSDEFSEKDGFNIRPFIATLHIINGVNKEWEKLGNKPVGLSKEEFSIFVPTTILYKDIPNTISEVILLRKKLSGRDKKEQDKIKREYYNSKINLFFNDSTGKDLQVNFNNLKDYGDNAIRYFKLTRFFYIRGGGFYIDLEPRRHIEITALLNYSNGEALKFKDLEEYLDFMDKDVIYPWETLDKLIKIAQEIRDTVVELNSSLKRPLTLEQKILKVDISKLAITELKNYVSQLRELRKEIQEYRDHLELVNADKFEEIINKLENIYLTSESKAVILEYLSTMCLHAINDALKIKPNYPVGDDNQPTFTAPSNMPDIECFYKSFNLICEVTMLNTRDQWINEGQPVMRHLRDFESKNKGVNLCLFVAPKIHRDTFNTFNISNKYEYEGRKQKIIPLSISQFIKILKRVLVKKQNNKPITQEEFRTVLEKLHQIILNTENVDEWIKISNEFLDKHLEEVIV